MKIAEFITEQNGIDDMATTGAEASSNIKSVNGKGIFQQSEPSEVSDKSLPHDVFKKIQSNIKKGAQDTTQLWSNALELVHRAYMVTGVKRPTPFMKEAWKQYEDNISYAVKALANARGIDGQWRSSSTSTKMS